MSAKPPPPKPPAGPATPKPPAGPKGAEQLLPVTKVAELWHCSRFHIYDLISAGKLRAVQLGTGTKAKTRVPESALAEYIAAQAPKARRAA